MALEIQLSEIKTPKKKERRDSEDCRIKKETVRTNVASSVTHLVSFDCFSTIKLLLRTQFKREVRTHTYMRIRHNVF